MTFTREDVVHGATLALVIGFSVVMGVATFTAGGPPTNPHVTLVRVLPNAGGPPTAMLSITMETYCLQPPNSIDNLGAKLVYSAYENGTPIAINYSAPFGILSGHGPFYTLGAVVPLLLLDANSTGTKLTIVVTAQVPTYVGAYFSSATVWHDGKETFGPAPDGRVWSQYAFNAYGPLVGAAAFDATVFARLFRDRLVVHRIETRKGREVEVTFISYAVFLVPLLWLTLLAMFLMWVLR